MDIKSRMAMFEKAAAANNSAANSALSKTKAPFKTTVANSNATNSSSIQTTAPHCSAANNAKTETKAPPKMAVANSSAVDSAKSLTKEALNGNGGSKNSSSCSSKNKNNNHSKDAAFEQAVLRCIPSEFNLIAGSDGIQEAQEVYKATKTFNLPNAKGTEGGLCTSAFLHILYKNLNNVMGKQQDSLTCQKILKETYSSMTAKGFDQVPNMTSSRPLTSDRPFHVVPPGYTGRRRALLIGINYTGQEGQLRAPQNDCHNVQQFLMNACGFPEEEMLVLVDDGKHTSPTRKNIESGFERLVAYARPGDVMFISFSGHGGRINDTSSDEEDGHGSSLMPVDFLEAGQIKDDNILKNLIKALPKGVHTTMVVDCCHSGSVGSLPYKLAANASQMETESNFDTDTREEILAKEAAAAKAEEERKKAKAERKKQREALRKEKAEEAARAATQSAAPVVIPTAPQVVMSSQGNMPAVPAATTMNFQASSPEEVAALAAKLGATSVIKQDSDGKGGTTTTITTSGPIMLGGGPMMVTPEQAAALSAQYGGMNGSPMVVTGSPMVVTGSPMVVTPEQAAAMGATQGGVVTGSPMVVTPEQAAAMGATQGGVITGSPMVVTPEQAAAMGATQGGGVITMPATHTTALGRSSGHRAKR